MTRSPKPSTAEFDVVVTENVMVRMRDGIRLATDVYRPAHGGKPVEGGLPVVFHRTPYDKTAGEALLGYNRWFAGRGYVAVDQDCRGCFNSEGDVGFLFPEAEDGFDTLEWIGKQPWSNGEVGSWGCSWASWTQTAMAALGPENLRAMVPNMSGANAHESTVRHGGAMELRFLAWAFWHSARNSQKKLKNEPWIDAALSLGAPKFSDWLKRMPVRPGETQLKLVPPYEKWAFEIFTHSDYDDYWKHPSVCPEEYWDDFPDCPVLLVGGWYDSYTRATFQNFRGLSARRKGPIRVLMGPWTHGGETPELCYAGDAEFGRTAAVESFKELHLRWFDRWLKGVGNGVESEPPLRVFVMGGGSGERTSAGRLMHGGRWRDEQEWPLARSRPTSYYLHADGSLSDTPPQATESCTTYRYDPAKPVPSIGGNVSSLRDRAPLPAGVADPGVVTVGGPDIMLAGGFDQHESSEFFGCEPPYFPLGSRRDVLVFQTAPLEEDTEVTGPISVKLWVSSTAVDTDFTAKLIDVYPPSKWYPNGYSLNLTDSIMRLRYRNGRERAEFLEPGEVAEVVITLYPTSNLFVKGHRIRLDISSSNFPRFDVNPNTGEPIGTDRRRRAADNTVHHDRVRPSHVVLPIVPAEQ